MKKMCTYCVMDNENDPTIVFDENGQCNYCRDALRRKKQEYFPDKSGEKELYRIITEIKEQTKGEQYNCMVGGSGGIDSSYLIYLGQKAGLKMLVVHIDDGMDTETAHANIEKLCSASDTELVVVKPDLIEYKDLLKSFLKASVPNLAMPQDNVLFRELDAIAKKYNMKYSLSGLNFATECILQRSKNSVNARDGVHIKAIHKLYGEKDIKNIKLHYLLNAYIGARYFSKVTTVRPLNYLEYDQKRVLHELHEFCGFTYYGGKHHESILTRFLQCYYLPVKFGQDKRKSHYSSLIVSGQMERREALELLQKNEYIENGLYKEDIAFLAQYLGLKEEAFMDLVNRPPKMHSEYRSSPLNKLAPVGRKLRKYLLFKY